MFRFDGFDIRPATTRTQFDAASMLVRRMYAWRGYRTDCISDSPAHDDQVILGVWQGGTALATLTLNLDSTRGLCCDELYGAEIDAFRKRGRIICEVSRLAIDPESSSRYMLKALLRTAQEYARDILGCTDAVIEVNPRHAKYYCREFGFAQIGQLRRCPRVDAPAVLLHQEIARMTPPRSAIAMTRMTAAPRLSS
ncbi:MAG: N-acyl amino acid synthase FeeM domain-containing protein [Betaproteobacteria bacterium]